MAPRIRQGKIKPRAVRFLDLWEGDIRNQEDHKFIEADIVLSCCEIAKAPDMGPHTFRSEVFFKFPGGTGCGRNFTFELNVNEFINEFSKEDEDPEDFSLCFQITKEYNIVKVHCAIWHSLRVQSTNPNLFSGHSVDRPFVVDEIF